MQLVTDTISRLKLRTAKTYRNLSMFPLTTDASSTADYILLDEALEKNLARVTEIAKEGSVPELRFENAGDRSVLLVDGEELVGARQNRVLNLSILVGGHAQIVIPVSCVERGRWSYVSLEFQSTKRNLYASARARKMADVSASLRSSGSRRSDQNAVWDGIAEKSARLNAYARTEAMADIYDHAQVRLDEFEKAFDAIDSQVGAVFAINGQIAGAEIFDCADTLKKLMAKLVGSYAMDAIDFPEERAELAALHDVAALLERIKAAPAEFFPAVGLGQDIRLRGKGITGAALVADNRVVHLSAFARSA